tara:strand:- start:107 stop:271 length:165 start_codon:yes stop_codon:yes gene_type:complete
MEKMIKRKNKLLGLKYSSIKPVIKLLLLDLLFFLTFVISKNSGDLYNLKAKINM